MTSSILTPSGKNRAYENFPVGSFLIARDLRRTVHLYYQWARASDDIADSATLTPSDKKKRLQKLHDCLAGDTPKDAPPFCAPLKEHLQRHDIPLRHATDLLIAFTKDADNPRYDTWDSLINDYCMNSAAPVGRFLLALHGEHTGGLFYSDALCNALQILNHLQDIKDDAAKLQRIYLPRQWMKQYGVTDKDCRDNSMTPALRELVNHMLDACDELISQAKKLPFLLANPRLRIESAIIVRIAKRLSELLRRRDPLARRVKLSKVMYASCLVRGIVRGIIS